MNVSFSEGKTGRIWQRVGFRDHRNPRALFWTNQTCDAFCLSVYEKRLTNKDKSLIHGMS